MTAFGACVLALTITHLPETAPNIGKQSSLLARVRRASRSSCATAASCSTSRRGRAQPPPSSSSSPPHPSSSSRRWGAVSDVYGTYFILNALGYMIGNFTMSRLAVRVGTQRMVRYSLLISFIGTGDSARPLPVALVVAVGAVPAAGGECDRQRADDPGRDVRALSARPELAGSAAGLLGATQLGISAALTVLIELACEARWPQSMNVLVAAGCWWWPASSAVSPRSPGARPALREPGRYST